MTRFGIRHQEELNAREEEQHLSAVQNQVAALARVSQALNTTLHLDDILQVVLDEALECTGAIGGKVSLLNAGTGQYRPHLRQGHIVPTPAGDAEAVATKQPVVLKRLLTREEPRQPVAALLVPIIYQDSTAGLIHLFFSRPDQLPPQVETFAIALANHAALALGNASRFRELTERNTQLQRRAQQIERVVEASRVFHSESPLHEVYEDLVYSIQEGTGFNVVLLSLATKQGGKWILRRVAAAGLPLDRLRQLQARHQDWDNVAQMMQPDFALGSAYFVPDHEATRFMAFLGPLVDDLYPAHEHEHESGPGLWQAYDIFFIPLRNSSGQPLGLISLDAPHDGLRPDLNTARVLEIFANQAAAAIENIQLFHNTREYANQLRQLNELSQEVLSEPDVRKRLERIVQGFQAAGWGRVALTLRDEGFNPTELIAAGLAPEEEAYLRDNLLPGEVWQQRFADPHFQSFRRGSSYFVPATDPWAQEHIEVTLPGHSPVQESQQAWHPHDLLFVPLFDRQQQPLAMIGLDQPASGRRPDEGDLQLIDLYARFAAAVIETIRLVDQILERNDELNTLFEASQAISGTLEQEVILEAIGRHMLQVAGASAYTIYRWQTEQNAAVVLSSFSAGEEIPAVSPGTTIAVPEYRLAQRVLETGAPQTALLNGQPPPQLPASYPQLPAGSTLALFPIYIRQELFGLVELLALGKPLSRDRNQMQLLGAILNQGSTALEMAHLFEDTYQRERFYAALGRVSLAINATLDLETVLDLICRESLAIFNVDSVYIWQRQGEQFVGVAAGGVEAEQFSGRTRPLDDETLSISLARNGRPQFVNRVQERQGEQPGLPAGQSIQALLAVPLNKDDEVIGALLFADRRNPERFTARDVDNASTFGVQTAIAIQNAQLVTELRELNDQLDERVEQRTRELAEESERVKILLRISTELTASLDKDRVLSSALLLVNEAINATQGNILLLDPETQGLVFHAAFDTQRQSPPLGLRSSVSGREGLAGWVFQNRQAAIVHDTRTDPRWIARPGTSREHRSILAVPLITGDEVIGLMMLFHHRPHAFNESQLELLEAAGIQVANAVYNANLYDLIRDQAERLGTMMRDAQVEVAKTQSILESIGEGVLVAQPNGEIVLVNLPACQLLDMTREELANRSVYELRGLYGAPGDAWLETIAYWASNADKGEPRASRIDQLTIDDKIVSVNVAPVFANRQYIGTVSILRDMTREVEVDRMKTEFVSTVSHELRTPMTSIKGYADLMLIGAAGKMNPMQDRYLRVIVKNADRLKLLVDDLLDISRIETGKTQLKRQPLDMAQVIMSVTNEHATGRLRDMDKKIEVTANVASALPLALADPEKVTRILTNLVDNALNYTPDGGRVEIAAGADGDYICISISDTGIGIAPDEIDKIFDRFYRSEEEVVQRVSGTGLGLAIVASLVQMHGGQITVDSRPGEGSTFTFTLPLAEDRQAGKR